jgi:hypothetical protein
MFAFLKPLATLFKPVPPMSTSTTSETFSSLLSPKLSINTNAFLDVYRQGIAKTKDTDRISALTRFTVKSITGNKLINTTSEHELLSVVVCDKATGLDHLFYIERSSASETTIVSAASKSIPSSALTSVASASATSTEISTTVQSLRRRQGQPSSTEDNTELTTCLPSPSPSNELLLPLPPPSLSRRTSNHSIAEVMSLTSARSMKSSFDSGCLAEDRISGSGRFAGNSSIGLIVRQILPVNLSLFELGILVDVIHNDAPSYSLLDAQCYWLTLMVFESVLRIYGNTLDTHRGVAPDQYLPKLSGKWAGFLIVAPKEDDLERVEKSFRAQRGAEFSRVSNCFTNFNLCISNLLYFFKKRWQTKKESDLPVTTS